MPAKSLLVFSNPSPGQEDAYNRWYDEEHLDEVLAVPGFVATTRYRLDDDQLEGQPECPHRYLAVYEYEGDTAEAMALLGDELSSGRMALPESIAADQTRGWAFTAITDRIAERGSGA
jgi:hypothetical protein